MGFDRNDDDIGVMIGKFIDVRDDLGNFLLEVFCALDNNSGVQGGCQ